MKPEAVGLLLFGVAGGAIVSSGLSYVAGYDAALAVATSIHEHDVRQIHECIMTLGSSMGVAERCENGLRDNFLPPPKSRRW